MNTQPFLENAEDLYQNAPFGYMTVRADGLIVNVNATLLKWLDYEWEEILLQKSFQDLLDMGGKIYFETHMMPMLLMQGEISEINIELKGKASIKLPTLVNASRIHDQSALETYFRFSILDITQRKSYELELIKARQEAEQTIQRLKQINSELEQFAYIASHDLQAPLRTISGLIALSEKKGHFPGDSEVAKYFSLIKRNAQRMKLMIGDLLDYAKIDSEELPFEEFSLNEACEIGLELIGDQVKENNAVITIPELPMVIGNKLQLARLFQNLFGNAIKYRSENDPVIRVEFEEKNDEIRVFVKDNGMGFEEDLADQVFGFMKRLHSHDSIPGTGIGLSACKRILEIHGGTIGATSEPGKGSTFYFTLPR
ncbi:MAG: ATP-binding protein [Algoriphagus sp.]|uniref:sensor histidine kinase n=1 Tax=Algoriphagus sp. TaxID=1872435 RepID=UPI00272F319C|nr:ATP-binding protein [Algoriphagus sp.]MDP2042262.1 ATP-binding protein [Algoriphagus sp.]MDP3473981.1 ATP-binding protein [Algoriphagus sp.]